MTKCGTVVLAGKPNVGKSTLLNALVGERLSIVSPKPQSTRTPVVGLLTHGDAQFIFTDCPGLLDPRYRLQEVLRQTALRALADAEVIAYLHPLADYPAPSLAAAAGLTATPAGAVVTVYTKADLVAPPRRPALALDSVAVSAQSGEGMSALVRRLERHLPESPFHYPADDVATQPLRFFAAEFVREAAFALLHAELPYSLACEIDEFREGETPTYIRAVVYVERESQKGIVIGQGGRTIKAIGQAARTRFEMLYGRPVYLDLHVKVLPHWRTHDPSIKRLGYAP